MKACVRAAMFASAMLATTSATAADSVPDPVFSPPMRALFEAPLNKVRNTVAPREADDPRGAVRCFSYPGLMVKEIDYGQHGDDQILVSLNNDGAPVKCDAATDPREMMLSGSEESYFLGAKGRYGFVLSTSGQDGSPLTIHDLNADHDFSIGGALFRDTLAPDIAPSNITVADGVLTVDYIASASAICSLLTGGTACWRRFVADAHLSPSQPPAAALCAAGYANGDPTDLSVLTFSMHLTIDAAGKITTTPGPVISCKPQA